MNINLGMRIERDVDDRERGKGQGRKWEKNLDPRTSLSPCGSHSSLDSQLELVAACLSAL